MEIAEDGILHYMQVTQAVSLLLAKGETMYFTEEDLKVVKTVGIILLVVFGILWIIGLLGIFPAG